MSRFRPGLACVALSIVLGFGVWSQLGAQLVINEVVASNQRSHLDEDGDSSDWIELANVGDDPIDVAGYSLSDDPADTRQWVFPAFTIPPREYVLVWCSGKDRASGIEPVVPELVAHWPLDEGGGVDFENRANDAYPGYLADGASIDWRAVTADDVGRRPAQDAAVRFTGAGSWVQTDYPGIGGNDPRTVACWIRTETAGANDILGYGQPSTGLKWHMRVNTLSGNGVVGAIRTEYQGGQNIGTTLIDDGRWHHIAAVLPEGATRGQQIDHYIDGVLQDKSGGDLTLNTDTVDPLYRLTIGLTRQGATSNRFFHGLIADVRVYANGIDEDGVLAVMAGDEPPPRVVPLSLHTSFELDADGDRVILSDASGAVVDSIAFPRQYGDVSIARSPDGTGDFLYHLEPTPLAANSGPASPEPQIVADTKFAPNRGIYDAPFTVEITSATVGATIRYTLDGSAPSETHGAVYAGPIPVADTTTLRALAYLDGHRSTDVDTQTYIFLDTPDSGGVLNQPNRPVGFPDTWGPNGGVVDYEMDPRVATDTESPYYNPRVREALLAMPTLSIVMNVDDFFDSTIGIHANPRNRGIEWERACSIEFIYPDDEDAGHQENCGIRIQGNASRNPDRPKHNMRLLFKRIYGAGKLRHAVFEDTNVDEFDTLILRGGNGDSWFHPSEIQRIRAQYIRDQWHRDVQQRMGWLTAHQRYMHLYINGLYWGLYHIFERPTGTFLASHLGGEREDWDANNSLDPLDGDLEAWNTMMSIANSGVGDAAGYAALQEYLDVPNLIDYLLINYYSGNVDWDRKNWYAGRRREPGAGYMFFCWDSERTYWTVTTDRLGLNTANRPTNLHQQLAANPEYRMLFADHTHRHFFNGGLLAPEVAEALWMARADEIEVPLAAEAARFGDNKRAVPYTVDVEWREEIDRLSTTYFPVRTGLVLDQIRGRGLYPDLAAPVFSRQGGFIEPGFRLGIRADAGIAYYTLDGSDPRRPGGAVSPQAIAAGAAEQAVLVAAGAGVRALVPTDGSLGLDWTDPDFDDSDWATGTTGVGFEDGSGYEDMIGLDVGADASDIHPTVYSRIEFDVADPSALDSLTLRMVAVHGPGR